MESTRTSESEGYPLPGFPSFIRLAGDHPPRFRRSGQVLAEDTNEGSRGRVVGISEPRTSLRRTRLSPPRFPSFKISSMIGTPQTSVVQFTTGDCYPPTPRFRRSTMRESSSSRTSANSGNICCLSCLEPPSKRIFEEIWQGRGVSRGLNDGNTGGGLYILDNLETR